ncbi:MAG: hypothetical protein QOH47_3140 [Sphingomonadales bacterium]|jgi:hypothetical protein|nr:hypothetical protein [Sphingomonadales bacterium]
MKPLWFASAALFVSGPALAQHSGHTPPAPTPPAPASQPAVDHSAHQMPSEPPQAEAMDHNAHAMPAMAHQMTGALGRYAISREASGTAWQPDASSHGGIHVTAGDWMLMGHFALNAVYDWQQGPRGDEMGFVSGMAMGMARRDFGDAGTLQLRAMLSPDPLMGRRGYPLHLASGETADGVTPLVDRQHPHDLFMELSASYSYPLSPDASVFVYAGLPGEPAFGPPAFMHRMSIMDSPEAPISHHWLDSTHISFGVVTAGVIVGRVKLEGSRFNGREPDQHRWNIETGPLDSTAFRLSWNPTPTLSLQASWAHLVSPEQLAPHENSTRWSASAIHTRRLSGQDWWSTTLAWGRRDGDDAFVLESAAGLGLWTLFGRAELTENDELTFAGGHHGPVYTVGKVSVGAIRDFRVAPSVRLGLSAQYALNFVPGALRASYGGNPGGAMAFIRLRVD